MSRRRSPTIAASSARVGATATPSPRSRDAAIRRARRGPALAATVAALAIAAGCERPPARDPEPSPPPPPPSDWIELDGSPAIGLDPAADDEALERAIEQARRGLDGARTRWSVGDEAERARWHVLWRVTPREGPSEHLWVRPLRWSPFRIEGRLANPPRGELVPPAALGDLVSFPIDEVIDWRRTALDGMVEGDALRRVLEARHGAVVPEGAPAGGDEAVEDPAGD